MLYEAPFVLLSHRVRDGEPPRWCYANKAALALFETEWDAFIGELSSTCAPPTDESQDERNAYLAKAMEDGSVEGIEAVRAFYRDNELAKRLEITGNACVAGREAAVPMRAIVAQGGQLLELDVIDVAAVNEAGKLTRLRAFFDLDGARPLEQP